MRNVLYNTNTTFMKHFILLLDILSKKNLMLEFTTKAMNILHKKNLVIGMKIGEEIVQEAVRHSEAYPQELADFIKSPPEDNADKSPNTSTCSLLSENDSEKSNSDNGEKLNVARLLSILCVYYLFVISSKYK